MSWTERPPGEPELSTELTAAVAKLRAKSERCPPPELLQAAQEGVLPVDLAGDVTGHLTTCRLCKSLLLDLEELDNTQLDAAGRKRIWQRIQAGMPAQTASTGVLIRSAWCWWKPRLQALAVATVAAIAVIATVIGVRFFNDRRQSAATVAQTHPSSLPTPTVFRLEKAPIMLPASAAILWRGQEDPAARQTKDLKHALVPYEAGDYAEAARRLDLLRKRYPRLAEAPFYLGIAQLFLNQNDDASKSLKDAVNLADQPLADQATWYLALALHRTGRTDLASSMLEPLCHAGRKNSDRACAGIKEAQAGH